MSVSATFEYDPDEHYRALRATTGVTMVRWMPILAFGVPITAIVFEIIAIRNNPERGAMTSVMDVLPYVLLGAFWLGMVPFSQRRQSRRLTKLDPSVIGPQERVVDAEGFHTSGNGEHLDVPWHILRRVVETDQFFLFFYDREHAYYIAKRLLSSDQVQAVRSFARAGLRDHVHLLEAS